MNAFLRLMEMLTLTVWFVALVLLSSGADRALAISLLLIMSGAWVIIVAYISYISKYNAQSNEEKS
jgi:uncharacterized protein YhhL (DUF1145 family)